MVKEGNRAGFLNLVVWFTPRIGAFLDSEKEEIWAAGGTRPY
jgi:hypothetical protein